MITGLPLSHIGYIGRLVLLTAEGGRNRKISVLLVVLSPSAV